MKSSQFTSGSCTHSVRSTRPGAAANCGNDEPYWYVMSGGSPPWRATVSFWRALSLLTNNGSTWMSGLARVPFVEQGVQRILFGIRVAVPEGQRDGSGGRLARRFVVTPAGARRGHQAEHSEDNEQPLPHEEHLQVGDQRRARTEIGNGSWQEDRT